MEVLFGRGSLVYNVHCLYHLPDFVEKYGSLDEYSMFPYENYMGIIKKRLKSGNLVFEQTVANIDEIRSVFLSRPQSELLYSSTFPNNCCLIDKKIVIIDDVEEENIVSGYCLDFLSNLFDYPYPSQDFNIGIYKKKSDSS